MSTHTMDPFLSNAQRALAGLSKNSKAIALAGGGLLLLVMIVGALILRFEERNQQALDQLFLAEKAFERELKALAPTETPAKNPQPDIRFMQVDVAQKFPETLKAYDQVLKQYPKSRAAFEATMALGVLHYNHGQVLQSLDWYKKAASQAKSKSEKIFTLISVSYAYEALEKRQEAIESLEQALKIQQTSKEFLTLKGDILLSIARNQELQGLTNEAKITYQRIEKELPDTESSRLATSYRSLLEGNRDEK